MSEKSFAAVKEAIRTVEEPVIAVKTVGKAIRSIEEAVFSNEEPLAGTKPEP